MNGWIIAARVCVGLAALVLLRVGWEALRRGPVSISVRVIAWAAGLYLLIGGILLLIGVL